MIDIHTHILFDVDDGSDTITESVALVKSAISAGVTGIIFTPHYTGNTKKDYRNENVDKHFSELVNEIEERNLEIDIFLGNEIAVYGNICEIMDDGIAKTLASSRYMLIEFPMEVEINYCLDTVYEMKMRGITPIIAHPERYKCVQENPELLEEYINKGALIQCNYASILGLYGDKAKKTVKKLLKNNLVDFLGSDCHKPNQIYLLVPEAIKKIKKIIGDSRFEKISTLNPQKILKNEEWEYDEKN